jgi:hypothetical protein
MQDVSSFSSIEKIAPGDIGEFGVVSSRWSVGDPQPLVRIDGAILIVFALVGTPIRSA